MPKAATAEVRWTSDGCAVARVTIEGKKRASFRMPHCRTEAEAVERARVLAEAAQRMRVARIDEGKARKTLDMLASAPPRSLHNAMAVANELVGDGLSPKGSPAIATFQQIGERWTKGELTRDYPDQIRGKRTVAEDVGRLTRYVYPVLGSTPIDRVSLDQCEEVMRRLPVGLAVPTRRNVGHMMVKIMRMAVYPLRLIERSPIPPGFLPSVTTRKAFAYLYPSEDARLLACTEIPLCFRLLWGFLSREGMREGEAIALTWDALDLARGAVRLDRNKTDDPRAWALSPGVAEALRAYREHHRAGDAATARVFTDPAGRTLVGPGLAELLRNHLKLIGLEQERPELFVTTAERQRIRVHDLRGTFVTVSLANDKSESWVSARTGHRSSSMIARYKRVADTFAELQQGELSPLVAALPDLIPPGFPRGPYNSLKVRATPTRFEGVPHRHLTARDRRSPRKSAKWMAIAIVPIRVSSIARTNHGPMQRRQWTRSSPRSLTLLREQAQPLSGTWSRVSPASCRPGARREVAWSSLQPSGSGEVRSH